MEHKDLLPYENTKYRMITCSVLSRESYACASIAGNSVDIQIVRQGLHDMGCEKMSSRLQHEIDCVETDRYEAILLGYGLCNNGVVGLKSKLPLVIPRAHDCITLLLGSKERYRECIEKNSATFFQSAGWLEQYEDYHRNPESTTVQLGLERYEDYVEKYGAENAEYLMEQLGGGLNRYDKFSFLDTGVGEQNRLKAHSRRNARINGWEYEDRKGDTRLLMKLMNGEWDEEEFLVVPPGATIKPSYDERVVEVTT